MMAWRIFWRLERMKKKRKHKVETAYEVLWKIAGMTVDAPDKATARLFVNGKWVNADDYPRYLTQMVGKHSDVDFIIDNPNGRKMKIRSEQGGKVIKFVGEAGNKR